MTRLLSAICWKRGEPFRAIKLNLQIERQIGMSGSRVCLFICLFVRLFSRDGVKRFEPVKQENSFQTRVSF